MFSIQRTAKLQSSESSWTRTLSIQSANTYHQPELGDNNLSGQPLLLTFPQVHTEQWHMAQKFKRQHISLDNTQNSSPNKMLVAPKHLLIPPSKNDDDMPVEVVEKILCIVGCQRLTWIEILVAPCLYIIISQLIQPHQNSILKRSIF